MIDPQLEHESVEFEVKSRAPRLRGKTIGLAVVSAAVLIAAGVIAAALIRTAAATDDPLAQVMPANVIAYFSMTTRPDQQPNFDVVAEAWKGSKTAEQVEDGLSAALTFAGFDWEKDILPWLGDRAAVGIVDLVGNQPLANSSEDSSSSGRHRTPFIVLAAQTRDREKSDAFLADYRAQRQNSLSGNGAIFDEVYRDIPMVYVTNDSEYLPPYGEAYATVNDVVVLATSGREDLKKILDAALDGTNLSGSENFKAATGALPSPNVGAAYVDYSRYFEAITAMMEGLYSDVPDFGDSEFAKTVEEQRRRQQELMSRMREMMQAFGGAGAAMTYEPSGIRFDVAMQFFPDRLPENLRGLYNFDLPAASNRIFESIPASAIAAMNMTSPAASWKALLDHPDWLNLAFGGHAFADEDVAGKIAEFEQFTGVDLGADLLDLLNGEFAFVVLPQLDQPAPVAVDPYSYFPALPFELAVMFDSSDAARASDSLNKLFEALIALSGDRGSVQPLDSLPASVLVDRDGGVALAYGVIDGRLVIGSNPDTLRAIDTADQAPLSADEMFKTVSAALPTNRLTSGYAQLEPVWKWLESAFGDSPGECDVCDYLRPIRWMSFAGETPDKASGLQRGTLHIGLELEK